MKIKSSTLVASACTVCIAAASGTVAPIATAATPVQEHHVVSRDYTLAASANPLLDIASLPFQNAWTIAQTLGGLTSAAKPLNDATAAFVTGQWAAVAPLLQKALATEIAAIQAVTRLPAEIIAYDLAVIASAFGGVPVSAASATAAAEPAAVVAAVSPTQALLTLAQLPLQNFYTVVTTLAALTKIAKPLNDATGAFVTGQWASIPPILQAGFAAELQAINNVLKLPATIIATDVAALTAIFGGAVTAQATTAAAEPSLTAAAEPSAAAAVDPGQAVLTVAQLPLQNFYTIVTTFAALTKIAKPLNDATGYFVTGQWDKIAATLQAGFAAELQAFNDVLQLPAKIIATDLAVLSSVFGAGATATATTFRGSAIEFSALSAALGNDAGDSTGSKADDKAPAANEKAADDKAVNDKAVNDKAADDKAIDEKATDDKAADEKAADEKAADDTAADEKVADEKAAADEKVGDEKAADDEKPADEKAAANTTADEKAAGAKASDDNAGAAGAGNEGGAKVGGGANTGAAGGGAA